MTKKNIGVTIILTVVFFGLGFFFGIKIKKSDTCLNSNNNIAKENPEFQKKMDELNAIKTKENSNNSNGNMETVNTNTTTGVPTTKSAEFEKKMQELNKLRADYQNKK